MWRSFIFLFLFIWSVGGIDHRSGNEEPSDDVSGTYLVISGETHSWYGEDTSNTDARPESSSERRADKSEPISAEYIPEENPFRRRGKFVVSGDCTFVPPTASPCLVPQQQQQQVIQPIQQQVYQPQQPAGQGGHSGCRPRCSSRPACRPKCPCRPRCPCHSKPQPQAGCRRPQPSPTTPPTPETTTSQFTAEEIQQRKEIKKLDRKEYHVENAVKPDSLFELLHPNGADNGTETGTDTTKKERVCKCKAGANVEQSTTAPSPPSSPPSEQNYNSQPQQNSYSQPQPQQNSYSQPQPQQNSYSQPQPQPQQNSYGAAGSEGHGSMPPPGHQTVSNGYDGGYVVNPSEVPLPANYDNSANFATLSGGYASTNIHDAGATNSTADADGPVCDFFITEYPNEYILLSAPVREQLKSIWQGYEAGSASCPKQEEETKKLLDGVTGNDKEEVECMIKCYPDHKKTPAGTLPEA